MSPEFHKGRCAGRFVPFVVAAWRCGAKSPLSTNEFSASRSVFDATLQIHFVLVDVNDITESLILIRIFCLTGEKYPLESVLFMKLNSD